jgi:uncharacterized membrane protein YebE (DUF533 family)
MSLFLSPQKLEIHHVQALVRAMHALALADGVHDSERVMLRSFYDNCQSDVGALTTFDEIIRVPLDPAALADTFNTDELKATFLQSLLFLAFADGHYTEGERAQLKAHAAALGVDAARLTAIEDAVQDHLMQQISRIENTDALREVAAGMRA